MIRVGTIDDIPALIELARAMHMESPEYSKVQFCAADIEFYLMHSLDDPDKAIFIDMVNEEIIGMIGGVITPYMFNFSEKYACDFGFYVRPASRGSLAGSRLIKVYEEWCNAKGIPPERIKLSESTGIHPEKVHDFLRLMGYNQTGTVYAKEV